MGIWQLDEAEEAAKYGEKPGRIKIKDQNKDGSIDNDSDRVILGSETPDFVMGLNNTFKYKNFDLRVFMYWTVLGDRGGAQTVCPGGQSDKILGQIANGCNSRFYNISCFSTAEKYIKKKCEKQIGTGGGQLGNSLHAKIHSYRVGDADNNDRS